MPQIRKGKGKASARPLAVPNLDNRPRYETPDPMQLATPGPTPRVQLHTTGVRNSENEERLDGWEEEQGTEKFKRMGKREWEQVGMFLLQHTIFDTELSVVETILGGVERRTGLAQTFDTTRKEWEGQVYKSYSEGPTSKSGEVGGVMVEFCDTIRSELGGSGLRGGIVRGMDSPTTRGLLLHVALHDHCGNHSLPYQSANIKTSNPSLSNMSNKGAEPVPAVGSDNAQNRTMQPSLHSYPKWESFCGDTGYSVVPLTGMHPVTSSPTWAAILHSRGLINFRASLSWESELPTTLILDTTPIRCNGPVAFVGKEDPDLGFVWVMEEVGDTGVAGKLVAVDELGTEEVLGQDAEEAARRVGWHLVREECEKSYWRN